MAKRPKRLYKDQYRIKQKTIYRYHDGAKPGDERYAVRDPNNRTRMNVVRSPFPGPGDVRYALSPNEKVMYRLHDGAPAPFRSSRGNQFYGFTNDEMTRFLDKRKQQETQRKNIWKAEQERRQNAFERQKALWEKQNAGISQLDVNEVAENLRDRNPVLGALMGPTFTAIDQAQNDKSILNRTFDLMSRGLFSVGETVDTRIEKDKKKDNFDKVRSFMQGLVDFGSSFTPAGTADLISGDKDKVRDRAETLDAMYRGFSGKAKTTPSMVLQEHYGAKGVPGFAGGLAADIALDPLTYTPAGLVKAPLQFVKRSLQARRTAPVADTLGLLDRATPPPRDIPLQNNTFDDIVDTRIPVSDRLSHVDRLNEAIVQPVVRKKFDDEATQGLERMVQEGRISRGDYDNLLGARNTPEFNRVVNDVTSRSFDRYTATPKPKPAAASQAAQAAPVASREASEVARNVVDAATRRAQINRQMVNAAPDQVDSLRGQVAQFDEIVGDFAPRVSMARASLEGAKGAEGARFRAFEKVSSNATRAVTNITKLMEGGTLSARHKPAQALARLNTATNPKEWEDAFMASLGSQTDIARNEVRAIVTDYTQAVGQRPERAAFSSREEFNAANRAWHLGLYRSIADSFSQRVNSQVTEAFLRTADADTLARLTEVPPLEGAAEDISENVTSQFAQAAANFNRPTPKEIRDLFDSIGEKSKTLEDGIKTQLYEIVALADRLPPPTNFGIRLTDDGRIESNIAGEWEDYLDIRGNLHVPLLAEFSYNNAIRKMFDPSYGIQEDLNELRLRLVGMANENVAFRVNRLKESLGRTPRAQRRASLNSLRANGVIDDTTQYLLDQTERILSPYQDTDLYRTAFGDAGQPNLGDLNRWLPEKFQFPGSSTFPGGIAKTYDKNFLDWLPENTDPLEYLWQLDIANEKVIAEKALLNSIADTYGIPRDNRLVSQALKDQGYVNNERYAEQLLFHPDVSRQIDRLYELMHRPREFNMVIRGIDYVQNMWRALVTKYNIPGFFIRNVIGDTFVNGVAGLAGAKGMASYRQSWRVLRDHTRFDELTQDAIHKPGGVAELLSELDQRPSINATLFKTKHGEDVSSERLWAEFIRRGLSPTQMSTELGLAEKFPSLRMPRRVVLDPIEKVTEYGTQFQRVAHFIHKVKTSDKPLEEAFDEAAESVRKHLYDFNDFTPFEREIMSRVFPFYRFMRKNVPHMLQMMFTDPGKAMIPDKALRNLSLAQGYEYDEQGVLQGELTPEWQEKGGAWPIAEWNGNTIYASPDYMFNTFLKDFGSGEDTALSLAFGQGTPLAIHPAVAATGEEYKFGELKEAEGSVGSRLLEDIPQFRAIRDLMDPGERHPGRYGQIAGVGTSLVRPNQQMAELMQLQDELEQSGQLEGDTKSEKQKEFEENSSRIESERDRRFQHIDALLELIENGR